MRRLNPFLKLITLPFLLVCLTLSLANIAIAASIDTFATIMKSVSDNRAINPSKMETILKIKALRCPKHRYFFNGKGYQYNLFLEHSRAFLTFTINSNISITPSKKERYSRLSKMEIVILHLEKALTNMGFEFKFDAVTSNNLPLLTYRDAEGTTAKIYLCEDLHSDQCRIAVKTNKIYPFDRRAKEHRASYQYEPDLDCPDH